MTKIVIDVEDTKDNLRKALNASGFEIVEALKSKLSKEHGVDTAALKSNIAYEFNETDDIFELVFSMPEQGKYVEWGTPPHMPPVESLEGWVRRKTDWKNKNGKEMSTKQKAWALAMGIKKRGTKPYPFIRPTFNHEVIPIIKNNLKKAFD